MSEAQKFSHHEGDKSEFEQRGLRSYFEYRDLGIADASNGEVIAHVIRAKEGSNATGDWHVHDCNFQMYYVIKGWINFEYEGQCSCQRLDVPHFLWNGKSEGQVVKRCGHSQV